MGQFLLQILIGPPYKGQFFLHFRKGKPADLQL